MRHLRAPLLATLAAAVLGACGTRAVHVRIPPPPSRAEAAPPAPGPNFVWIPGHWVWSESAEVWSWQRGFHARRPAGATGFAPGRWERRGLYWRWVPGRWLTGKPSKPEPRGKHPAPCAGRPHDHPG